MIAANAYGTFREGFLSNENIFFLFKTCNFVNFFLLLQPFVFCILCRIHCCVHLVKYKFDSVLYIKSLLFYNTVSKVAERNIYVIWGKSFKTDQKTYLRKKHSQNSNEDFFRAFKLRYKFFFHEISLYWWEESISIFSIFSIKLQTCQWRVLRLGPRGNEILEQFFVQDFYRNSKIPRFPPLQHSAEKSKGFSNSCQNRAKLFSGTSHSCVFPFLFCFPHVIMSLITQDTKWNYDC